jgi:thioredoxin-related protein
MKIRVLFVVLLSISFFVEASTCENYKQAWSFFNQNNRVEARKYFNLALNEPDCKSEAYLG